LIKLHTPVIANLRSPGGAGVAIQELKTFQNLRTNFTDLIKLQLLITLKKVLLINLKANYEN
jgi:hypothetical protein